ncbi:MAG: signal peptidase I [bacterium]|nr:signal peptidase I [bacterium]
MKEKIIKSVKLRKRKPFIAFILSFFFTGLGQTYNGEITKGIILLALRILSLLFIPLYVLIKPINSYLFIFAPGWIFSLFFGAWSPFEALITAFKNREVPEKKYNFPLVYSLFGFLSIILLVCPVILIFSFFHIQKTGVPAAPYLGHSDFVLVLNYIPNGCNRGDLVIYKDTPEETRIARIMAIEGDSVKFEENIFYINEIQLPLGVLNNADQDILTETNNKFTYSIKFNKKNKHTPVKMVLKKKEIFIVSDNRMQENIHRVISPSAITGRIEGIVLSPDFLSPDFKKLLLRPFREKTSLSKLLKKIKSFF